MSPAQWLIAVIGLTASAITYGLMRFPQHRREEYRGDPFSQTASVIGAVLILAFSLACVVAQGAYEAP